MWSFVQIESSPMDEEVSGALRGVWGTLLVWGHNQPEDCDCELGIGNWGTAIFLSLTFLEPHLSGAIYCGKNWEISGSDLDTGLGLQFNYLLLAWLK